LEKQALSWGGVIAVAVYIKSSIDIDIKKQQVFALFQRIERLEKCRLDITLVTEQVLV
jgi:hypothetical protein